MQKWEYKIVHSISDDELNALGEQGWELVAVVNTNMCYFKRPKSS